MCDVLLEVRNLVKCFRSPRGEPLVVLDGLSFSVRRGEFLTIVGPSGAGKTTLLNLLARIEPFTAGEVRIQSQRIRAGDEEAPDPGCSCRIGYVTQDDSLLPWRTALENVLLPLQFQRRCAPYAGARELMRMVGLAGFENHYPRELSGGMRKRVALIRTLVYDPPIILMDEPFASVDAEMRATLQEDLLRLCAARQKTVVFVTHDITEAITLGDRTLVLSSRPAHLRNEHVIDIPRPRDVRGVLADSAFAPLYRAIRANVAEP
jgi:NitT/TauT family transport system ATP-binding protein